MLVQYTVKREDFNSSQRLVMRSTRKLRILFVISQRILPVLGVFALGLLGCDILVRHFKLEAWQGAVLALIAWLGLYFPVTYRLRITRLYKRNKQGRLKDAPVELELTEDELISRVPGRSEARFKPVALLRFFADENVGLLYVTKDLFLLFPRRALTSDQWESLTTWLEARTEMNIQC